MIEEKQLEMLSAGSERRLQQFEEDFLRRVASRVRIIEDLSGKKFDKAAIERAVREDIYALQTELMAIDRTNAAEVEKLYRQYTEQIYADTKKYYDAKGLEWVPYDQNEAVQRVADAVVKETQDHLTSLSKTTVVRLTDKNGEHDVNFAKAYADTCELASIRAASGVTSYDTEIRDALKSMSKEGVRVRYESGLTRRLDSAVRMNILDGLRAINQQVQNEVGRQFGADGYEISVHMASAPDHEDLQGRQYSLKEYADLNSRLKRPIGHLNCHHFAFAILLGVSVPNYSNQELAKIKADNHKGFTYEGKHYTMYEGSQLQRKLETAVRYAKEEQLTAAAYGDAAWAAEAQDKIRVLKDKYTAVSNASGLPVKSERMGISGYRWNKGVKKSKVDKMRESGIILENTVFDIRKLTEYALNPEKDVNKATAFKLALGYDMSNAAELKVQIMRNLPYFELDYKKEDTYGKRYECRMQLRGPNGKTAEVLTAWIQEGDRLRLTSAYVKEPKNEN